MSCFDTLESLFTQEDPVIVKRIRAILADAGTAYNQVVSHIQDKNSASFILSTLHDKFKKNLKEATASCSKDTGTFALCVHNAIFQKYRKVLEFFFNYNEHGLLVRVTPKAGDTYKLKRRIDQFKEKTKVTLLDYKYKDHGHPMDAKVVTADNEIIYCSMTDLRPRYSKSVR